LFGSLKCGYGINPTWRHNLRLNWETPWKLLVSAQWRYIGATSFDNNSSDPSLHFVEEGFYDFVNARIPSYSYLDLSAVWKVWGGIELTGGINNVFDKAPPLLPSLDITIVGTPNTFPAYDVVGRQLFVAFRAKF
jgi:outer membrane receptor for ferrienterochelin and colicin